MKTDFEIGMKVFLNDEFGIVIKSELNDVELIGIIRWDTPKMNDLEDWSGLFGTFISLGGKIINEDYRFKFIDDNGNKN
jgi:hypothetical protein